MDFSEENMEQEKQENKAQERRVIEMAAIQAYFKARKSAARNYVIANVLFWLAPFVGIFLSYRQGSIASAGVVFELLMLCAMAALIIVTILMLQKHERKFRKGAELAEGVRGAVLDEQRGFDRTLLIGMVLGVISLLLFFVPVVIVSGVATAHELAIILAVYAILLIFAFGFSCIIYVVTIGRGYRKVLKIR